MLTRRAFQGGMLLVAAGATSATADLSELAGTWSGVLDVGSQRLRLKLDVGDDGAANLFSLDQGRQPHAGRVTLSGGRIEIDFPKLRATFTGRIPGANQIQGVWRQGALELPLVFERGEAALAVLQPTRPLTNERLAELRAQAGSPAIAAASVRGTGIARVWVDGERATGTGIAVHESDRWHLGSIGKSMTASLVARLVDSGGLRWDETVGDLLDAIAPDMDGAYRAVTFRHLLCHRSGLPKDIPAQQFTRFSREASDAREERKAFARQALALAPKGPMGATYEYSNNGYVVVGAMLEAKLGQSWESLIRTHLFETLNLTTAGFGAPGREGATDQPVGHSNGPAGPRAHPVGTPIVDNPVVLGPAGRIHMSLKDLLVYLAAHRDRTSFLQPQTWAVLHRPPFGGEYAMGWVVRSNDALWHNGSNTLWYAEALFDAGAGIVAAAVCNDGHMAKSAPAVGRALLEAAAAA